MAETDATPGPEKGDSAEPTFEERVALSPIHLWADVEDYCDRMQMPASVRRTFHEILVARGEFPANITSSLTKLFASTAFRLTEESGLNGPDAHALMWAFSELTGQWVLDMRNRQRREQ